MLARGRCVSAASCALLLIAACAGNEKITEAQAPPREAATPGECYGSQIRCEPPVAIAWEPGPELQCDMIDYGPAQVEWTVVLTELANFESSGELGSVQVTPGDDRSVWVAMDLSGTNVTQGHLVAKLDAAGRPLFASTHEYLPSRLDGPRPAVNGSGADARGHLLLARPGRGVPALELWDYAPGEDQPSVWRLAENVYEGWVRVSAEGRVAALYRHAEAPARSIDAAKPPPLPAGAANVAMFDAAGKLEFNQTFFSELVVDGRVDGVLLAALPPGQGPLIWTYFINPGINRRERALLTQLDVGGNTLWQRELLGSLVNSTAIPEGGLYVLHASSFDPSTPVLLERLDSDGRGLWRLPLPSSLQIALIGVDDRGRALILDYGNQGDISVYAVSADGTECGRVSFDVCNNTSCPSPLAVRGRSDAIYLSSADGKLGRAALVPEPQ